MIIKEEPKLSALQNVQNRDAAPWQTAALHCADLFCDKLLCLYSLHPLLYSTSFVNLQTCAIAGYSP